jgi:uncharacterized membrane protein
LLWGKALDSQDAQRRLKQLEDRLARIERALGIPEQDAADVQPTIKEEFSATTHREKPPPVPPSSAKSAETDVRTPTPKPASAEGPPGTPSRRLREVPPTSRPSIPARPSGTDRAPFRKERQAPSTKPAFELEQLVGMKAFLAIGALVVVIGMGFFLKYGFDQGWFRMSSRGKCFAGAGFGFLLLIVGEGVRHRINALASAGFTAAGLGTLYATTLAAYGRFELLGVMAAFVLLALCAGIGIALSARARLASVANLSLIGGYSALFLLLRHEPSPWVIPAYLIMLLGVGLALSGWLRGSFMAVRSVAWWATILIGGPWALAIASPTTYVFGTGFVAIVWAMVHGELFAAARGSNGAYEPIRLSEPLKWARIRAVLVSFSTTAWCAGLGVFLFSSSGTIPDWMAPLAGLAATVVGWNLLASHLRVLRERPTSDAERLGAGLAMQAGGLLIAAVSIGLSGQAEVMMWLAMGVGAVLAGRWLGARSLHVYGLVTLAIGTTRLLLFDSFFTAAPLQVIAGLVPTLWMLLTVIGGIAWLAAAWTLHSVNGFWARLRNVEIAIGLTVVFLAFVHEDASTYAMMLIALLFSLLTLATARWRWSLGLAGYALGCLSISSGGVIGPMYVSFSEPNVELVGLVLSWWSLLMLLTASAWAVCGRLIMALGGQPWSGIRSATIGVLLVFVFGAAFDEAAAPLAMCLVWLALAHGLGLASRRFPDVLLDIYAPLGVLASLGMWTYGFVVVDWGFATAPALLHPGLWSSLAIAVSLPILFGPLRRSDHFDAESRRSFGQLSYSIAVVLVLVSTSFEASRVGGLVSSDSLSQRAVLTIWWGIFGFGLIVAGFRLRVPPARYAGLALIVIATGKAILFDLTETQGLWRVASIIGPGLLMLVVAAGYAKVSARMAQGKTDETDESPLYNEPKPDSDEEC